MADPRFHRRAGPFRLGEIAERAGARLSGGANPETLITDVAPLQSAGADELSFLDNVAYLEAFAASAAGTCVVAPAHVARAPSGMALLITEQPYRAYARAAQSFYPKRPPEPGIAPNATVDPSASLGPGCRIEAGDVRRR